METKILVQEEPLNMSQLIEIPVTANGQQRVQLPDIQQLRSTVDQNIIIKGLRLITPKVLTNGMTVAGVNAPLAELRKISLVLYSEAWERGQMIPLLELNDFNDSDGTAATTIPFRNQAFKLADWAKVDWPKSYLLYANGTSSANAPYVVMIDVSYLKLDVSGAPITTPR